jgi:hypothetical protein
MPTLYPTIGQNGGFAMLMGEATTLAKYNLPAKVVNLKNNLRFDRAERHDCNKTSCADLDAQIGAARGRQPHRWLLVFQTVCLGCRIALCLERRLIIDMIDLLGLRIFAISMR